MIETQNTPLSEEEKKLIYSLFDKHLITIGVLGLSIRLQGYKRIYLILSFFLCAYLMIFQSFSILICALPIVPMIIFSILYFVDMNIMIQRIVLIQKVLMSEYNFSRDLEFYLDVLQNYAKETNFFNFSKR